MHPPGHAMKHEHLGRYGLLLALSLLIDCAGAEDFKPGVQHICVPNAARDGWDCGTVDDPPKPTVAEEKVIEIPTPSPPAFLANPEGPANYSEPVAEAPPVAEPEPMQPVAAEPGPAEAVAEAAEPAPTAVESTVAETEPETMASAPLAEPVVAETETLPEPETSAAIATAAVAEQPPAAQSEAMAVATETSAVQEPAAPVSVESIAEPAPESVVEVPEPPSAEPVAEVPSPAQTTAAPAIPAEPASVAAAAQPTPAVTAATSQSTAQPVRLSSLQGAREFALLAASEFTLQMAHAATADAFPALINTMGLNPRLCYVLRVRRDGGDWWLLAYGNYVDANTAKRALMQLRPAPGMTAVWPRRIGYLQGEYRP